VIALENALPMQKECDTSEKRCLTLAGGIWEGLKLLAPSFPSQSYQHGRTTPENGVVRELGSGGWLHEITQEHAKITYSLQVYDCALAHYVHRHAVYVVCHARLWLTSTCNN
jgi:hypothetical protein